MNNNELCALANWHEERAQLARAKLADARDQGLSHKEQSRLREQIGFHHGAATGLNAIANAFSTLAALGGGPR